MAAPQCDLLVFMRSALALAAMLSLIVPAAALAATSFVTGYALSGQPLRNDFAGWVGMKLTVGANPHKLMGDALLATGRPIVFALCEYGNEKVWTWGPSVDGNLWRTTSDVEDNWYTMSGIGFSQYNIFSYASPGHWNDPDMLEIGNGGMTTDEYRTHMSLWAILAAPLLAGNDVRSMTADTVSILLNSEVIAVDQDVAGIQGHRLSVSGDQEIWVKPLSAGRVGVGLFNRGSQPANISVASSALGFSGQVSARDLWTHQAVAFQSGAFQATVPSHGVVMLRVDPVP